MREGAEFKEKKNEKGDGCVDGAYGGGFGDGDETRAFKGTCGDEDKRDNGLQGRACFSTS
jgi:hypothetical protein